MEKDTGQSLECVVIVEVRGIMDGIVATSGQGNGR